MCRLDWAGITLTSGLAFYVPAVTSLVAGTMFLMWLGEQITERGVGNGISMIIFAGIVAGLPNLIMQSLSSVDSGQTSLIGWSFWLVITWGAGGNCIYRKGPTPHISKLCTKQQGRRVFTAQQTHLPLKLIWQALFRQFCQLFAAVSSKLGPVGREC